MSASRLPVASLSSDADAAKASAVERTFAWLGRCRRLAKDFERSVESAAAWALVAHIRRLTRLIATHCSAS